MGITPVELRNLKFETKFRGFDPTEVTTLINLIAEELETTIDQNVELERQVRSLSEKVATYQTIEDSLKETLLTAQRAAEEQRQAAKQSAEAILMETEVECERRKSRCAVEIERMQQELASLRKQKVRLSAEMRALIDSHARILEHGEERSRISPAEIEPSEFNSNSFNAY